MGKKDVSQARFIAAIDKEQYAKDLHIGKDEEPGCFAFLCEALDHPLPEPWQEHADKKGRVYYWNPAFRQSTWQHPLISTHKALRDAYRRVIKASDHAQAVADEHESFLRQGEEELSQWRQSHAADGTAYYYKIGTQLTRWDNPRDHLMSIMELRTEMLARLIDIAEEAGDCADSQALAIEDRQDEALLGPEGLQGMHAGSELSAAGIGEMSPVVLSPKSGKSGLSASMSPKALKDA